MRAQRPASPRPRSPTSPRRTSTSCSSRTRGASARVPVVLARHRPRSRRRRALAHPRAPRSFATSRRPPRSLPSTSRTGTRRSSPRRAATSPVSMRTPMVARTNPSTRSIAQRCRTTPRSDRCRCGQVHRRSLPTPQTRPNLPPGAGLGFREPPAATTTRWHGSTSNKASTPAVGRATRQTWTSTSSRPRIRTSSGRRPWSPTPRAQSRRPQRR